MEYATMPASRTAESLPTPSYESPDDATKNNVDLEARSEVFADPVDKIAINAVSPHVKKRRAMKGSQRKPVKNISQAKENYLPTMPDRLPESATQPKHAPMHRATNSSETVNTADGVPAIDDEESLYAIDRQRGFTVVNKRERSRDELLNTPLDQLIAGIDKTKLTENISIDSPRHGGKHSAESAPKKESLPLAENETVTPNEEELAVLPAAGQSEVVPVDEYEVREVTQRYRIPPVPDRGPVIQRHILSRPDHEPTVHLGEVDNDSGENEDRSLISNLMAKARTVPQFIAAHVASFNTIQRNKNADRTDQERHRRSTIKRVIGMTAVVLAVTALSRDNPDFQHTVGEMINNGNDGILPPQGALDPIQERIVQQHTEILNSLTNVIPVAGGGEAFTVANGADPSIWYQNQAEFLQLFPNEAYLMPDGNVGFDRPGELSDQAKEYWARKFGQWR